jgi:hypothetical protein
MAAWKMFEIHYLNLFDIFYIHVYTYIYISVINVNGTHSYPTISLHITLYPQYNIYNYIYIYNYPGLHPYKSSLLLVKPLHHLLLARWLVFNLCFFGPLKLRQVTERWIQPRPLCGSQICQLDRNLLSNAWKILGRSWKPNH